MKKDSTIVKIGELSSDNVLSQGKARGFEHFKRGKELFKITPDKIRVRKDWNVRIDYGDIQGLADSILENGLQKPLVGDLLEDGTFILSDGHRRFKAISLLLEQGNDMPFVAVEMNDTKITDEARLIQMWTANDSKPLEPMEKAEVCRRLNIAGYDPEQIRKKLGISLASVYNYFNLAGLSVEEKNLISAGTLSVAAASKLARQVKSPAKRKEIIKQATEKATSGAPLTVRDVVKSKPLLLTEEIEAGLTAQQSVIPEEDYKLLVRQIEKLKKML